MGEDVVVKRQREFYDEVIISLMYVFIGDNQNNKLCQIKCEESRDFLVF